MKNSKKLITSLLLIAVIGIWGYVGYSFFSGSGSDEITDTTEPAIVSNEVSADKFANQELNLNYTDPFLKQKEVKRIITQQKKSVPAIDKTVKKEETAYAWPEIKYKGLIVNQSNNEKKLAILVVNGKESIIREGETIADVRVVAFDKSKVEMKHEKELRVFMK
ncbi:MAG: hypothetical protein ACHQF2_05210 [Flavobacteriales bacterium]